jgi:hypothetical protein
MTFGIITNGRALTDEMVRFFNARDFTVCVSWDGPHVKETRGYDVFSVPEIRERILALEHLCLSAVLSAKAYPREVLQAFQQISEEYSAIHGYQVAVNLDEIMDTGLPKKDLLDYRLRTGSAGDEGNGPPVPGRLWETGPPRKVHRRSLHPSVFPCFEGILPDRKRKVGSVYCCLREWSHCAESGSPGQSVPLP